MPVAEKWRIANLFWNTMLRRSGKLWLLFSSARKIIALSFCDRWTISEDQVTEVALLLTDQFGVDLNIAECINRQIRRLRRGCQENFTILNTTFSRYYQRYFVVFLHIEVSSSGRFMTKGLRDFTFGWDDPHSFNLCYNITKVNRALWLVS